MRVLVIDDDRNVREVLRLYLDKEGYGVAEAANGLEGLDQARACKPDFIILDIMLPGLDGWAVCRALRREIHVPIIMLTAKGDEVDRIMGLEMGADDYLTKPFSPGELMARIRAILRRTGVSDIEHGGRLLRFRHLLVRFDEHSAALQGRDLPLTPKEFDLLWFLASQPGRAFSRETILEQVWGYDFEGDLRTVDAHVKRLRQKLECQEGPRYLHTVWGVGYKFEERSV